MRISDWSSDVCSSDLEQDPIDQGVILHMAVRQPEGVGNLPEFRRVLQERAEPDRNQGMQVVQGVVDDVDHARTQLDIGLLQGMVVRCQQPQRPTLDLDDGTVDLFPDMAVLALYDRTSVV